MLPAQKTTVLVFAECWGCELGGLRSWEVEVENEGGGEGLEERMDNLYMEASVVMTTYNRMSRFVMALRRASDP